MKKIKNIILSLFLLVIIVVVSGYTKNTLQQRNDTTLVSSKQNQTINMFVTHGHCSTPFTGIVKNLSVHIPKRDDLGNPLENMSVSFEIDPNSFQVCAGDDLTRRIKTPGLFIGKNNENIIFKSTEIYTMGLDWYQINGKMSINGVEKDVKLFATGIRNSKETIATSLVLEGQMNLFDWGIDYDKIVTGHSEMISTKWMHVNMKIALP
jgi:polyisoprenoid-binding protein YceI